MSELISVIIPTYNRVELIGEAIKSVLDQDYEPVEIIVVVDGSTDNTLEVLKKFPTIKIIRYKENQGLCYAKNKGLELFRGAYTQFLNDDDVLMPHKLKTQAEWLRAHPNIDIVFSDLVLLGGKADGTVVTGSDVKHDLRKALIENISLPVDFNKSISCLMTKDRSEFRIGDGTNLTRRRVFDSGLKFDRELEKTVTVSSDYDMWLQMILAGFKFEHLPFNAMKYRMHEKQMTVACLKTKEKYLNSRKFIYNKFKLLINQTK